MIVPRPPHKVCYGVFFVVVVVYGESRGDKPEADERKKLEDPLQKSREGERTLREDEDVCQLSSISKLPLGLGRCKLLV